MSVTNIVTVARFVNTLLAVSLQDFERRALDNLHGRIGETVATKGLIGQVSSLWVGVASAALRDSESLDLLPSN